MSITADKLKVQLFADGADKATMLALYANPLVKGFTTNPTLMHKAGVRDYVGFAKDILTAIPDRSISFEVFSDEVEEMERQARFIATWGKNVYVKIPVTNTRGVPLYDLVNKLSKEGIQINFTAIFTDEQVEKSIAALGGHAPAYISVFAGRVADTGIDPVPAMARYIKQMAPYKNLECIWASPRELLNVVQAHEVGCHIITATSDIINRVSLLGTDLAQYSLDAVKAFRKDSLAAGFSLPV